MPEDYFGQRVAARYDESSADMFDPAVVDPVVDFLVELADGGAALELGMARVGSRFRSRGAACACTGSTCRRQWSRSCAPSRVPSRSV